MNLYSKVDSQYWPYVAITLHTCTQTNSYERNTIHNATNTKRTRHTHSHSIIADAAATAHFYSSVPSRRKIALKCNENHTFT